VPIALPDFSAVSCTEPLLVLSIWAIPSRVLYACDFVFFFCLGRNRAVTIACPISQLRRVPNLCSCYLSRQYPYECYTLVILPWIWIRTVPIACPISQLRRVPNLCSCYLPGHIIHRQYPHECYTLVIPFCSLGFYLEFRIAQCQSPA